jgi:hypothetical protein
MSIRRAPPARQQGVALVLVLWILLLVTISTSAYTLMARMDQLEAHTVLSGTRARLAAEAGMNLALLSLRDPDEAARLVPDGRPYELRYEDAAVEVRVTDERGKLDINAADEQTLLALLTGNGLDVQDATVLAAAIMDWKDGDEGAGHALGPLSENGTGADRLLAVWPARPGLRAGRSAAGPARHDGGSCIELRGRPAIRGIVERRRRRFAERPGRHGKGPGGNV